MRTNNTWGWIIISLLLAVTSFFLVQLVNDIRSTNKQLPKIQEAVNKNAAAIRVLATNMNNSNIEKTIEAILKKVNAQYEELKGTQMRIIQAFEYQVKDGPTITKKFPEFEKTLRKIEKKLDEVNRETLRLSTNLENPRLLYIEKPRLPYTTKRIEGSILAIRADTGMVELKDECGGTISLKVGSDINLDAFGEGEGVIIIIEFDDEGTIREMKKKD